MEGLVMFRPGTFDVMVRCDVVVHEQRRHALDVQAAPERKVLRRHAGRRGGGEVQLRPLAVAARSVSRRVLVRLLGLGVRRLSDDPKNPGVVKDVIVDSPLQVTFVLNGPSGTFLRTSRCNRS